MNTNFMKKNLGFVKGIILLLALPFFVFSCSKPVKNSAIYDTDILMYPEYLEYIKLAGNGRKAVVQSFQNTPEIQYSFKEFSEVGTNVLIFFNKTLNQQYFVFYSDYAKRNKSLISLSEADSGLNASKTLFNKYFLDLYLKIETFIEDRAMKDVKKIIIGFDAGGVIANMYVYNLITNYNYNSSEFEVIAFGMPGFASNLKVNFDSKNITLKGDEVAEMKLACCTLPDGVLVKSFAPTNKTQNKTKLDSYVSTLVSEGQKAYMTS